MRIFVETEKVEPENVEVDQALENGVEEGACGREAGVGDERPDAQLRVVVAGVLDDGIQRVLWEPQCMRHRDHGSGGGNGAGERVGH